MALRDAVLDFGELAGPEEPRSFFGQDPARPLQGSPPARERVRLLSATARPTVEQITQRLAMPPVEPKGDPDHVDDWRRLRDPTAARS